MSLHLYLYFAEQEMPPFSVLLGAKHNDQKLWFVCQTGEWIQTVPAKKKQQCFKLGLQSSEVYHTIKFENDLRLLQELNWTANTFGRKPWGSRSHESGVFVLCCFGFLSLPFFWGLHMVEPLAGTFASGLHQGSSWLPNIQCQSVSLPWYLLAHRVSCLFCALTYLICLPFVHSPCAPSKITPLAQTPEYYRLLLQRTLGKQSHVWQLPVLNPVLNPAVHSTGGQTWPICPPTSSSGIPISWNLDQQNTNKHLRSPSPFLASSLINNCKA